MSRAVPSEMRFDTPPLAVPSSTARRVFTPSNGAKYTYSGSNTTRLELSCAQNEFLDSSNSYLSFQIKNTNATEIADGGTVPNNYLCPDTSPAAAISSIRVSCGSVELEYTRQYGRLHSMLELSQSSLTRMTSSNSVLGNCQASIKSTMLPSAAVDGTTPVPAGLMAVTQETTGVASPWSGHSVLAPLHTAYPTPDNLPVNNAIFTGKSATVCIPLVSALLGGASKYVPLGLSQGLVVEINWAEPAAVGIWTQFDVTAGHVNIAAEDATGNSYEVSNVEYCAQIVTMDRSFVDMLKQSMGDGTISLHGLGWAAFENSYSDTETHPILNVPVRKRSINSMLTTQRYPKVAGVASKFITGVSSQMGMQSYLYRIGSVSYPAQGIRITSQGAPDTGDASGVSIAYAELQKALGQFGDLHSDTSLSRVTYGLTKSNDDENPDLGDFCRMFIAGLAFNSFNGSKSVIEDGVSTSDAALNCSLELTRESEGSGEQIQTCTFVSYDVFYHLSSDGVFYSSS